MTTISNLISRKAFILCLAVGTGALALIGQSVTLRAHGPSQSAAPAPGEPTLAEVRAATERFRDVKVALAEGYIRDPMNMCETAEMMGKPAALGGMGIHYFRPDMLGISGPPNPRVNGNGTYTDFRKPAILIYEPQRDGSLELVAVENLVFAKAWKEAGHTDRPTFHGVAYDYMVDDPATQLDEAHMFEPHYDRHVWVHRSNPNGDFAPFNPAVTCKHHQNKGGHQHPLTH
ncbi:MAG: hypothetical protein Q8M24_02020 [Pseudolabrys sp.]|nr:hypothetical protein [Pseudolabrys sp.]MDP2294224.1 hypothetical protein [Pseudolabrys sp.]